VRGCIQCAVRPWAEWVRLWDDAHRLSGLITRASSPSSASACLQHNHTHTYRAAHSACIGHTVQCVQRALNRFSVQLCIAHSECRALCVSRVVVCGGVWWCVAVRGGAWRCVVVLMRCSDVVMRGSGVARSAVHGTRLPLGRACIACVRREVWRHTRRSCACAASPAPWTPCCWCCAGSQAAPARQTSHHAQTSPAAHRWRRPPTTASSPAACSRHGHGAPATSPYPGW
jgi:hypothetical protein